MIRRNTWILIVVFAALVGFAFYLQNQKTRQAAAATPTSGTLSVFTPADGNPTDIKIVSSTGQTVELVRGSSGSWGVTSPIAMGADPAGAEAAASQVGALQVLGDFQLAPDVVGLDKPADTLTVVFSNGKTHKLVVGSVNPIQTGYYAQLDGGKSELVDKPGLDALLGMLANPPYAQTLTPTVTPTVPPTATSTPAPSDTPTAAASGAPASGTSTPLPATPTATP